MNENNPLVSVVIATYNMGRYLPEAVESVRSQTYSPIELIIVDDGSTDDTQMLAEQWRDTDGIRYFRQDNQGQTRAKNKGIIEASGAYIAFLDADDRWKKEKLALQMPQFDEAGEVGVVYCGAVRIDETGRETGRPAFACPQGRVTRELLHDNFVPFGSAVIARSVIDRMGAFDETLSMSIDYDLWLRISAVYQFRYVDEALFEYRIWSGQMSSKMLKRLGCVSRVLDKFEREYPDAASRRSMRFARASTFVSRAMARVAAGQGRGGALRDLLNAIIRYPFYPRAWKSLVKVLINRVD